MIYGIICALTEDAWEIFCRGPETHIPSYSDFSFSRKEMELIDDCVFFFSRVLQRFLCIF